MQGHRKLKLSEVGRGGGEEEIKFEENRELQRQNAIYVLSKKWGAFPPLPPPLFLHL